MSPRSRSIVPLVVVRPMKIERSRCVHAVPPIAKDRGRLMKIVRLLTLARLTRIGRSICVHVSACESSLMMVNPDR